MTVTRTYCTSSKMQETEKQHLEPPITIYTSMWYKQKQHLGINTGLTYCTTNWKNTALQLSHQQHFRYTTKSVFFTPTKIQCVHERPRGAGTGRSGESNDPPPENLPGVKHGILIPRFFWKNIFWCTPTWNLHDKYILTLGLGLFFLLSHNRFLDSSKCVPHDFDPQSKK